ncbi:MAG: prolipoprotein diacylglyceryl transferase [Candidatus Brocadiia bacterium]
MHPYLFNIPVPWGEGIRIASYGFMIMCGFMVSLYIARRRARKVGIDPAKIFDLAVGLLFGGIVGARLFYVIQFWDQFADNLFLIARIDQGGLVFYGGLLGGGLVGPVMMVMKNMPLRRTLDVLGSVVPLGHAFGRIGCFLEGCCFGHVTESWIGVQFPQGSPAWTHQIYQGILEPTGEWSRPVHPTQLYAVLYNVAVFALLTFWFPRRRRNGEVAWIYAFAYGLARFGNEFIRVTQPVFLGLTVAQLICIPLVVFGGTMLIRGRLLPPEPMPQTISAEPKDADASSQ